MKIIERYLSAYVVSCLFGYTDPIHMGYVYQVLRESGSSSDHPLLSKVLDFIRQGDPEDPQTRQEVADYVTAIIKGVNPVKDEPKSNVKIRYSISEGYMALSISRGKELIGIGLASAENVDETLKRLQEKYPDAVITQV